MSSHLTLLYLAKFLKDNGVLVSEFNRLVKEYAGKEMGTLMLPMSVSDYEHIINMFLHWAGTPQGHSYWADKHHKWKAYYKEKLEEKVLSLRNNQ